MNTTERRIKKTKSWEMFLSQNKKELIPLGTKAEQKINPNNNFKICPYCKGISTSGSDYNFCCLTCKTKAINLLKNKTKWYKREDMEHKEELIKLFEKHNSSKTLLLMVKDIKKQIGLL